MVRKAAFCSRKPSKFNVRLNDIQNQNFLEDFRMGGHEMVGHFSGEHYYGRFGPMSAQIASDHISITSDKVAHVTIGLVSFKLAVLSKYNIL